ncbi:hypothetical protein Q499_0058 [Chlamydia suis MD56]|uniref:hypothetical protein n=1 Tax=Chlamydia suis TaxID=83559 RepID=UPI0003BFEE8A|nr:hypothetical protein [Chlamydia suis]ESN89747.1 hypothetical protein Q499_0058 [Chlamydia suis MD56]
MSYKKNNTSSSLWNNSRVVTKVLLNVSETGIESTPGIIKNAKKITQSEAPTDPSDAVTLKYLKDNYTKENDPNPGFLATTGGTMTGSIDMQGNNITNLAMYPNGQQNPEDHSAITINYVNEQADAIKTDKKITDAVTRLSDIDTQVATLNQLLGITDDPEADNTTAEFLKTSGGTVYGNIDMNQKTISDLGTPTNQDTKSAINVEFVQAKITSPQMAFLKNNDEKLSHVVSEYFDWLQDPNPVVENPAPDPSQPNAGTSSTTNPSNNSPSPTTRVTTSIQKYAATPSGATTSSGATTPDPDPVTPNTTFSEKSPLWEEFFSFSDSSRSAMVVQKTGILTFSMQGSWEHPTISTNSTQGSGGSPQPPTPTKTQDPISLELTVTAPQASGTTTPPSSPPTTVPDTITKKFTLSAGQSCTLQIPVQAEGSILQLKYVNPNKTYNDSLNNQGTGGATATPASGSSTTTPAPASGNQTTTPDPTPVGITLKSFAWSLVLTPGEIEKTASSTQPPAQP